MEVRATPESVGISSQKLLSMLQEFDKTVPDWQGIAILRHNQVIAQGMKKPYDSETPRILYSLSKSFAGLAVGLLVTDGLVKTSDIFIDYHRDKLPKGYDPRFEELTIRDILRFNSNRVTLSTHFIGEMGDWVKMYLGYTLPRDPGTGFEYDTGGSMALCSLVNATTGRSAFDLLNERIFMPLGISDCCWLDSPQGYSAGGWGLYLSMDSLVKIAKLWMNMGKWEGRQLISYDYMKEATTAQTSVTAPPVSSFEGYGYQFWIGKNTFNAVGAYGTAICCCPDQDIAVVLAANSQGDAPSRSVELLNQYLFHVKHPDSLPEDPQARDALNAYLENLELPLPKGESASLSYEQAMFNRMIFLQENRRGISAIYLRRTADDEITLNLCFSNRSVPLRAKYRGWATTYSARAGIRTSFEDERLIHIKHCSSYAMTDDTLFFHDQLMHTNNTDLFILRLVDGKLEGSVQVSTILGAASTPEPLVEKA